MIKAGRGREGKVVSDKNEGMKLKRKRKTRGRRKEENEREMKRKQRRQRKVKKGGKERGMKTD